MKKNSYLYLALIVAAGWAACHHAGQHAGSAGQIAPDTLSTGRDSLVARDTPTNSIAGARVEKEKPVILKTHLKDTSRLSGSFILFLLPDQARYAELSSDPDDEVNESDADFAAGIVGTKDSLRTIDKYRNIRFAATPSRYIVIADCYGGPLVIDRDTVSYGYILSGKGKKIATEYNSVHSGNYLGEIDEYFGLVR
ncbi:MAG: hypothetical protein Q8927_10805 [Bacteroidota bacterium]|nr:hypothetical protein [Bacteroidota bacterium]MDP4216682.1 hypothetical protein [Bacteroidota bacterium]MDP4244214.1 hypothetical protein [Bacteroidota bacterium]MDP4253414.1 hypothetical protein [Bacteroidota bacterium]